MIVLKSTYRVWIKELVFSPNGASIAAAAGGSGLLIWNELTNGTKAEMLTSPLTDAQGATFTSDGSHLLAAGGDLYAVRLDTRAVTKIPVPGHGIGFLPLRASARVITSSREYDNRRSISHNSCWSLDDLKKPVWSCKDDASYIFNPLFVNDDEYLVLGMRDRANFCQQTRSTKTGKLVSETATTTFMPDRVAISPDATRLATTANKFIYSQPVSGPFHEKHVAANDSKKHFACIAYHPSGKYLATASNDETVKLFDATTWEVVRTFTWKTGKMRSVCFSPDGTLAAAGGEKGLVIVWDVDL